ncbi:hypothetical protein FGO68_gene2575 [Halteria grandinella]|uniref:Uncharacterized protein n=1 Tax=Halteria grandinella TaxID=5974 RepID=A0A8J8ND04_HALGN|nr:hypothetical protein FGO68_gene2575 [Halteria grandinella]
MHSATQQRQSSPPKHLPGYTGYRPQYVDDGLIQSIPPQNPKDASNVNRIPGYCGYIPGVKAENVFGESYGKTSAYSGRGQIVRGFDQEPVEKFRSVAQQSFQNQKEVQARLRAQNNASPFGATQGSIDHIPKAEQAKFFGLPHHEVDAIASQQATIEFYASQGATHGQVHVQKPTVNRGTITLPFEEARKLAKSQVK